MMADSIGNKDWMAVVVSKDSMNVFRLNDAVNSSRSLGFAQAVNAAIREQAISGVSFTGAADGSMGFKTQARDGDKAAVACIVEIDKQ